MPLFLLQLLVLMVWVVLAMAMPLLPAVGMVSAAFQHQQVWWVVQGRLQEWLALGGPVQRCLPAGGV
jgi:hypothetical protein